jgi:hypothetical protein
MGLFGGGESASAPMPMQRDKVAAIRANYEDLSVTERAAMFAEDLKAWAGAEREMYWGGSRAGVQGFADDSSDAIRFERIGTVELAGEDDAAQAMARGRRPTMANLRRMMKERLGGGAGMEGGQFPMPGMMPPGSVPMGMRRRPGGMSGGLNLDVYRLR